MFQPHSKEYACPWSDHTAEMQFSVLLGCVSALSEKIPKLSMVATEQTTQIFSYFITVLYMLKITYLNLKFQY